MAKIAYNLQAALGILSQGFQLQGGRHFPDRVYATCLYFRAVLTSHMNEPVPVLIPKSFIDSCRSGEGRAFGDVFLLGMVQGMDFPGA